MKILLFDDDKSTVDMLLQTIPWAQLGITQFAPVYSVAQAKEVFLHGGGADLMICDIEAPGGTGLDLLRWVRANGHATENIFLTNHEQFAFAAEAMRLDSVEYILKMSPVEDVVAALRRAIARLQQRSRLQSYADEAGRRAAAQFWQQVLCADGFDPADFAAQAALRGVCLPPSCRPVLCAVAGAPSDVEAEAQLRQAAAQAIAPADTAAAVFFPAGSALLVLADPAKATDQTLAALAAQLAARFAAGRGNVYAAPPLPPAQVYAAVQQLRAEARADLRRNGALVACPLPLRAEKHTAAAPAPALPTERWVSLLRQYETGVLFAEIQAYVESLCRTGPVTGDTLWQFHHDYLQLLFSALAQDHIEAHLLFHDMGAIRLCDSAPRSAYHMLRWVDHSLARAVESMKSARNTLTLIEQVKAYIDQHYTEKVTRADIAAHFYMSADYLSHAFGKRFGMSIPEYVCQRRIDHAAGLLLRGSSITDAALASGFDSLSYFSTVFKRQMGMTPGDYRRK